MEELRIVLLGKQGAGKSSAGNTLLGRKPFHAAASSQGVTQTCSKSTSTVDGQRISVVDTPGWTDFRLMDDKTILEIAECIALSDPGPHVFLLVIPIGRFTKEEIDTAQQILEVFGEETGKYTMVLFTKGDDLEEKTIEEYLEGNHPDLKKILEVCGERYHVLNNRDNENHMQVFTLLEMIKLMVKRNKGRYYTKAMYQKTADQVEEKWKREKMLKAMMENEYRRQMRNSAVGSNDEAMVRNDLEYNSNMKTTVSERKEDRVDTPYCTPYLNEKMAGKQNKDSKLGYKKPLHNGEYHSKEYKTKEEAEQQRSMEMFENKLEKMSNEMQQMKRELVNVKRELQEFKDGQQQIKEKEKPESKKRWGNIGKHKLNFCKR